MSKKPGNKGARSDASAIAGDSTNHGATPAVLRNPPSGKSAKAKRKAAAKRKPDAFSAWLDRTLPRLQERLADVVNIDVTTPIDKIKN